MRCTSILSLTVMVLCAAPAAVLAAPISSGSNDVMQLAGRNAMASEASIVEPASPWKRDASFNPEAGPGSKRQVDADGDADSSDAGLALPEPGSPWKRESLVMSDVGAAWKREADKLIDVGNAWKRDPAFKPEVGQAWKREVEGVQGANGKVKPVVGDKW